MMGTQSVNLSTESGQPQTVRELERLRQRVGELEHANRRLERAVAAARADGERAERERSARTMGGRLPSILTWR